MKFKAIHRYASMSPRKMRLVADMVRGLYANHALEVLAVSKKRAARMIEKVIKSAIANAEAKDADVDELWIESIWIDPGPIRYWRRYRARHRVNRIRRRTSHINVVLSDESEENQEQEVEEQTA